MGEQGKVIEALNMLRRYEREAGDAAQVGPIAALRMLEQAFTEQDVPTLPRYEMVKGGDLNVGDQVLLICMVTATRNEKIDTDHVMISAKAVPDPWNVSDQYLWTWGGEHGSGVDRQPDIMRVTW